MESYTEKIKCPTCCSNDCNDTVATQVFYSFKLKVHEVICNSCGRYVRRLIADGKEVARKTNIGEQGGK